MNDIKYVDQRDLVKAFELTCEEISQWRGWYYSFPAFTAGLEESLVDLQNEFIEKAKGFDGET